MPWFMKGLSYLGTAAMFVVGGGILLHGIPALEHPLEAALAQVAFHDVLGGPLWLLTDNRWLTQRPALAAWLREPAHGVTLLHPPQPIRHGALPSP